MQIIQTKIEGLFEIQPVVHNDNRGWFYEFYREDIYLSKITDNRFVQENHSFSKKGVVRGLHLQLAPYEQAKVVSVMIGKIMDVVVDLRKDSATFGKVHYCLLDGTKHNMLVVPAGFAHGFAALEDSHFFYKCSNFYHRESETGIVWNDPDIAIEWGVKDPIISEKDCLLPTFEELMIKSVISR